MTFDKLTPGEDGFSIADLVSLVEDSLEGENGHTKVIVRLPHKRDGVAVEFADCQITSMAVESETSGVGPYKLVLDIENPLE